MYVSDYLESSHLYSQRIPIIVQLEFASLSKWHYNFSKSNILAPGRSVLKNVLWVPREVKHSVGSTTKRSIFIERMSIGVSILSYPLKQVICGR